MTKGGLSDVSSRWPSSIPRVVLPTLVVLGVLALAIHEIPPDTLHVRGLLSDQVEYVSGARRLAEEGTLASSVILPSTLKKATTPHLYMPGHYLVLALSYTVCGYGALASILPSFLLYLAGAGLLGSICRSLGFAPGPRRAAMLSFALYPPNVFFAMTALSEMTVVVVALAAYAAFLRVPDRWRPIALPVLLIPGFVCRETAALLVIPMAFAILGGRGRRRVIRAGAAVVAGVILLGLLIQIPPMGGRMNGLEANLFDRGYASIYGDAYWSPSADSPGDWVSAIVTKSKQNVKQLAWGLTGGTSLFDVGSFMLVAILCAAALVTGLGARNHPRRSLMLGSGLLGVGVLGVIFMLYMPLLLRGTRVLMFVVPHVCLVIACLAERLARRSPPVPRHLVARTLWHAPWAILTVWCVLFLLHIGPRIRRTDARVLDSSRFVASLGHDMRTVLVADPHLTVPSALHLYPLMVAHTPSNARTLELLMTRHEVGTLLLRVDAARGPETSDLTRLGFRLVGTRTFKGQQYAVFRR